MDLSVLVISWNTRALTRDCLVSVFAGLGGVEAEVIVVDNASADGSADMVAEAFAAAELIRNDTNRGFAAANNQALSVARGRYVLLLNSDTVVHGGVLAASVAWMDANPGVGALGCRVLNPDGSAQDNNVLFPTLWRQMLLLIGLHGLARGPGGRVGPEDPPREVEAVAGCYLMVRREVVEQVGPLDEAFFFFGEETDWCRRIREAGWRLVLAPVGEITHLGGGSVRRLNHRRDVMLSQATVRLQRKYGGRLAGVAGFVLVAGFNLTRAAGWTVVALLRRESGMRDRAEHFRAVAAETPRIWPGGT